jgi:katanin p60 ATPase-containing subunit A1
MMQQPHGPQPHMALAMPQVGKSRLPQWALDGMRGGNQPGALAKGSAGPAAAPGPANKRKPAVPTRQVPSKVDSWQQPRGGPAAAAAPASGRPSAAASGAAAGGVPKQAPAGKAGEYSGPDGDLWAALARDVLEASLNVKFDDIAGLSEAKRVLQEAILLPMLMPEMFTGICKPVKVRHCRRRCCARGADCVCSMLCVM